jgi:hypothetical protein
VGLPLGRLALPVKDEVPRKEPIDPVYHECERCRRTFGPITPSVVAIIQDYLVGLTIPPSVLARADEVIQ